ncbi:polyphosphate kinase 2 [Polynucleobacter sp. AP-Capit-er-40B-B4]|uniref:polyphosphate kinase 2 n=1 Tax=Polynucleobacter sp. AP-Capit-er-40B-B4 TaxID=2576927 RepID=UPI001C0BD16E|nr:polyphosphate kinase 2 [Polynucleobacter sp. AP-Capit-er-40B-B4]MBU3582342.1 polyphosphate kinase 2 [Polynucleobacter sp. AP-Capit-er-40B-B4]
MSHKNKDKLEESSYDAALRLLQIELVKLQNSLIKNGDQILVILEGRDTAGKDGTIKAITEHLSPRETRIVALGKPSDTESTEWYFQRYVAQLPKQGEFVLFNRSWYNRAGVERVMNFCTKAQYVNFMETVNDFESILVRSDITILKYYLDISKKEQALRLEDRENDPLKQWKISPIDQQAQKNWNAYSKCRNEMLERTSPKDAPWTIVMANDKKLAHLNLIRDLLSRVSYPGKDKSLLRADKDIAFKWDGKLSKLEK